MTSLFDRFETAFMPNYGVPPVALERGEGSVVWDADGDRIPRHVRRHRGQLARPRPPGARRGGLQAGRDAGPHLEPDRPPARGRTRARGCSACSRAPAQGLPGQLGHRGQRGGAEARDQARQVHRPELLRGRRDGLPRPDPGRAVPDRQAVDPRPVRAVPARCSLRPVRRRRRPGRGRRRRLRAPCSWSPRRARPEWSRPPTATWPGPARSPRRRGALLVADEIQSAIGRTGHWFAHQADGYLPDILTLAKGLGGGLPIGACIGFGAAGTIFDKGDHGSTFGGNPVSCAAALAVLDNVDLAHVRTVAAELRGGLEAISTPCSKGSGKRTVAGRRSHRGQGRPGPGRRAARPASWSTPYNPTRSGSRRRS